MLSLMPTYPPYVVQQEMKGERSISYHIWELGMVPLPDDWTLASGHDNSCCFDMVTCR